jgi:hypothetical protein
MWSVRRMPQKACPHASPFPSNVCAACISTQPPGAFLEIPSWRTALHEFATAGRRILPVTYHPLSSNVPPRGRVSTHHHAHSCTQHRLHSRPPCSSICGIKHRASKQFDRLASKAGALFAGFANERMRGGCAGFGCGCTLFCGGWLAGLAIWRLYLHLASMRPAGRAYHLPAGRRGRWRGSRRPSLTRVWPVLEASGLDPGFDFSWGWSRRQKSQRSG